MRDRLHAIVRGRVQMVMYRDFAQRKARRLGVVGTVQNLSDGTVEVIAEAEKNVLDRYVEKLKKGSMLSRVDGIDIRWLPASGKFSDFVIVF